MRKGIILGATSAIAIATARELAARGDCLLLVARSEERLEQQRNDLLTRGAKEVYTATADLADLTQHETLLRQFEEILPGYDTVIVTYGTLGDQQAGERDFDIAMRELQTNFLSIASFVTRFANAFEARPEEERQHCTIAVVSSVAGDRGRKSNYIYGTAKGALSIFLQGVRNRLAGVGVTVLTVKPGFVDTPMTAHMKKGPLFAQPEAIGKGIVQAIDQKRDIVYLPWFWCPIMAVIRSIPERFFKRMSI